MSQLPVNTSDDTRGVVRAELKALQALVSRPGGDKALRAHLDDLKDQIARILDPKFAAPSASTGATITTRRASETCWPGLEDLQD
jgi:hypothetical protein